MRNIKHIIEAILFLNPDDFTIDMLAKKIRTDPKKIKEALDELIEDYNKRDTVIGINKIGDLYNMNIKKEFIYVVKRYIRKAELTKYELKIAAIVLKNPNIKKSSLVKSLGPWVYPSVKELVKKGFLTEKRMGRTSILNPTEKLKTYVK